MSEQADEKLAQRARRGCREAFTELVARYARRVFSLCLRMTGHPDDAEDLTQEVFLRAYQAIGRFDPGRRFAPWLFTIAANACRNHLRDRAGNDPLTDLERANGTAAPPAEAPLLALEDAEAIRKAIAALDPLDRLAILLRYEESLSLEETAAALEMPRARAAVRICRAKAKLREELRRRAVHAGRPNTEWKGAKS